MLTKRDIKTIEEMLDRRFSFFTKEVVELFTVTNERIDKLEESVNYRLDKIFGKLHVFERTISRHERLIGKIEEKVYKAGN